MQSIPSIQLLPTPGTANLWDVVHPFGLGWTYHHPWCNVQTSGESRTVLLKDLVVFFRLVGSRTAPMAWLPVVSIAEKERPWRWKATNVERWIEIIWNYPTAHTNTFVTNMPMFPKLSIETVYCYHFPIVNMPTSTHAVHAVHAVHQTACHCLRIQSMELDVRNILGSMHHLPFTFGTHPTLSSRR